MSFSGAGNEASDSLWLLLSTSFWLHLLTQSWFYLIKANATPGFTAWSYILQYSPFFLVVLEWNLRIHACEAIHVTCQWAVAPAMFIAFKNAWQHRANTDNLASRTLNYSHLQSPCVMHSFQDEKITKK